LDECARGEVSHEECIAAITNWDPEVRKLSIVPLEEDAAARTQRLADRGTYETAISELQTTIKNVYKRAYNQALTTISKHRPSAAELFKATVERDFYQGRQYEDVQSMDPATVTFANARETNDAKMIPLGKRER